MLASSAQAAPACSMKNNSSDDGSFKCKVDAKRKLDINTSAGAFYHSSTTASSNVGGNTISAGEDAEDATIGGGNATTSVGSYEDINSLDLVYKGLPDGGTPSVDISNNSGDDPKFEADVKEKSDEKIDDHAFAGVHATETLSSNGGGNTVSADEDNTGSTISGSNATTSSDTERWVNFRRIRRK